MSGRKPHTGDPEKDADTWGKYERPGDVHHMKCHNCIGFIIFIALLAASVALLIVGIRVGRPWLLTSPWDHTGNFCGYDNRKLRDGIGNDTTKSFELQDYSGVPFLFFGAGGRIVTTDSGDMTLERPGTIQYCVKECPSAADGEEARAMYEDAFEDDCSDGERICPSHLSKDDQDAERKPLGKCICPYPTEPLLGRCIPLIDREVFGDVLIDKVQKVMNDLKDTLFAAPGLGQGLTATIELASVIPVFAALALVIGFVWILLLRCIAPLIVYFVVIAVPVVIAAIGVWFWVYGQNSFLFEGDDGSHKIVAGICFGIAAIILVIVIFLWGKLKAAVTVIGIAGRALWGNLTSLAAPIISLILLAIFWGISLASALLNYSSADFKIEWKQDAPGTEGYAFLTPAPNRDLQYVLIYILIYLVFISVHVYFTNYYAQSSAVVDWYFRPDKGGPCNLRCLYGFGLALGKGLGTIAISSLVMTPVWVMIIICEYLDQKAKQSPESIPVFVRYLIKCMKCCLYCFEKFLRYLNKALLTFSQIYNTGWWTSAKLTINVLLSDVLMTAIMNGISTFILWLSKLIVAALTTLAFVAYVKTQNEVSGWVMPAFIVFFVAYIVASFLLGMFSNVIDIVFVCYQSDQDLTGHGALRPLYISSDMESMVSDLKESAVDDTRVGGADS